MNKSLLLALVGTLACSPCGTASATTFTLPIEDGEYWWGGHVTDGLSMPFSAKKDFSTTLIGENAGNQASGLLVSSHGRFIHCSKPFSIVFKDGRVSATGEGAFQSGTANNTNLCGAYRQMLGEGLFKASGKMPDKLLFTAPQWNSWIELTYNQNQADLLKYADSILANGFPPCVLMIDDTWQAGYGAWRFDNVRFPDPKAMCDALHKKGFKIMLWICPFVSADTPEFRELEEKKGLLMDAARPGRPALFKWWNGYSACLDFSSPAGMKWFKDQLDRLQKDYGVDGFKFDAGDAAIYAAEKFTAHEPAAAMPEEQSRLFGVVGLSYPLNEYRAMWRMNGQPLVQRLCDKNHSWHAIRQCVADILVQGLEGYPFACPDMVGGGSWTAFLPGAKFDKKLVVRSAQTAALMPMIQFSLNPWRVMTAPGDEKYLDAIKKVVAIRQARVPQILALAENAAKTGEPIVRHMAYVFPNEGMEEVRDQFVLGDDLIVAPVLDASDARTVRLPAGQWRGDDGTVVTGPTTLTLKNVPLDRLPRYERVKKN